MLAHRNVRMGRWGVGLQPGKRASHEFGSYKNNENKSYFFFVGVVGHRGRFITLGDGSD